ncbi:hypothetical protein [Xenorhabdus thuongxuanensis]|nr:hypothetical protein [Xenorhabdus thuongxuanensis]
MKKKLTLNKTEYSRFICLLTGKYQQAVMLFISRYRDCGAWIKEQQ